MSEWIKHSDVAAPSEPVLKTDGRTRWIGHGSSYEGATHWMPLPAPPPRTIMVEINEDAAKHMSAGLGHGPDAWKTEVLVHIGEACAKALEAMR